VVARGIAHAIDAEYGIAAGLVACADYSGSLTMDQLLMRLGKYNRQSEASRLAWRSLTARGPTIFGIVAILIEIFWHAKSVAAPLIDRNDP
jgi:hypothetical protein